MKRFITKYYFLPAIALFAFVSVVAVRCKKPTDGININVNTSNLFHYTGLVQITDPSGSVPNNLTVTVTGANAAAVYGLDGKKAMSAPAGIIAFAIHPKMEPTATSPLKFNFVVTGAGYLPLTLPVTVTVDQKTQVIKASILNLVVPTAGVTSATTTATAAAGTVVTPITVSTAAAAGTTSTAVTVPTGVKLQDANGNTINGNNVTATVNNFQPSQALSLFPGGTLVANIDNGSGTTAPAALIPAGFVNIQMGVNGTEVKKFSSPIAVSMNLDPSFKNPSTGAAIASGTVVEIDSYDTGTGQWKFEQNATVSIVGGNPVVNFSTSHLTIYAATIRVGVNTNLNLKFTTNSTIGDGQSYTVTYAVEYADRPGFTVNLGVIVLTDDGVANAYDLSNFFPAAVAGHDLSIKFFAGADILRTVPIGSGVITSATTNLNIALTLTAPGPLTDFILKLDCGSVGSKVGIFTPPDFYMFYKKAGDPVANYVLLGLVQNGELLTNQLASTQNYDFKAVVGSSVKEVFNHNIAENVSGNQTVGDPANPTNGAAYAGKAQNAARNIVDIRSICNELIK